MINDEKDSSCDDDSYETGEQIDMEDYENSDNEVPNLSTVRLSLEKELTPLLLSKKESEQAELRQRKLMMAENYSEESGASYSPSEAYRPTNINQSYMGRSTSGVSNR